VAHLGNFATGKAQMTFIADKIRIAKDGSVSTIADPADQAVAIKTMVPRWPAKLVCEHLAVCAGSELSTAKVMMMKLMADFNFPASHMSNLLSWMDSNWKTLTLEKRAWTLLDFFYKRCP
jgi:hypothetical protein